MLIIRRINIIGCVIARNTKGGIATSGGRGEKNRIIHCTIVSNKSERGGGINLYGRHETLIQNSILWDNVAIAGNQISHYKTALKSASLTVTFSTELLF